MQQLDKAETQWFIKHMQKYLRSVIDAVKQRAATSYLTQSFQAKVAEERPVFDHERRTMDDLSESHFAFHVDMYEYGDMLQKMTSEAEFGGFNIPESIAQKIQWSVRLEYFQTYRVDGSDWSLRSGSRRLRHISGALSAIELEDPCVGSTSSLMVRLHTAPLWSALVHDLFRVMEQVEHFSNRQRWRAADIYTLTDWIGKYSILFGMALVHETVQDREYDHDIPYAWQESLVDGETLTSYRHRADTFRRLVYTVGMMAPIADKSQAYRDMLRNAVQVQELGRTTV